MCVQAQDVVGSTRWRIEIGDGRGEVREMKKSVVRQVTIEKNKLPICKPSNESRDPRKCFGDFFFLRFAPGIKKRSVERREKERQGPESRLRD